MKIDNIVIGGGAAGLTAANVLGKSGREVLLIEKESLTGGLVNSYSSKGFVFDSGIRAIEDAGMVNILLKKLDINLEFLENPVSIGIGDRWVSLSRENALVEYEKMLGDLFSNEKTSLRNIFKEIEKIEKDLSLLYSIDNPLFLDKKDFQDISYLTKTLFPWLIKMKFSKRERKEYRTPVEDYLRKYTKNQRLIDMICQHFFKDSPASFALGYFSLYKDYKYPKGSTGEFSKRLRSNLNKYNVKVIQGEVVFLDPNEMKVRTESGEEYFGENIIWAGNQRSLFEVSKSTKESKLWLEKYKYTKGNDSILSLDLGVNLDSNNFKYPHSFYTPSLEGISSIEIPKSNWKDYIVDYLKKTTFEISIPSLRDENLSPKGKTGILVSTLMDYSFVKNIEKTGEYDEFKNLCEVTIIDILNDSIFPNLKNHVIFKNISTPVTFEKYTGNFQGAINGWAFSNDSTPALTSMKNVKDAVLTPFKNIYQCGHWTFSPSGLPVALMTGKLAADKIISKSE